MDLIWDGTDVLVAGPDRVVNVGHVERPVRLFGLRFDPGVGVEVLGLPATEITDRRVRLDELWDAATHERWRDRLGTAADPLSELECLARTRRIASTPPWLAPVVEGLVAGRSVAELADLVGYTTLHLTRLAADRFGYGATVLGRVLRFQRALPALAAGVDVTHVAAATGYAGAAHLHREVRLLTGRPVSDLRRPPTAVGGADASDLVPPVWDGS